MESWEIARFRKAASRLFRANLRSVAAAAISSPLMDIFGAIAIALLLLLGRQKIVHNEFTLGAFGAFIAAVFSLYNPVRKFALFNNNFQQALGASSEIFKFMDSQDEIREKPAAKPLPPFSHSIRFENVGFSYEAGRWREPRNPARHQFGSPRRRSPGGRGIERRGQDHAGAMGQMPTHYTTARAAASLIRRLRVRVISVPSILCPSAILPPGARGSWSRSVGIKLSVDQPPSLKTKGRSRGNRFRNQTSNAHERLEFLFQCEKSGVVVSPVRRDSDSGVVKQRTRRWIERKRCPKADEDQDQRQHLGFEPARIPAGTGYVLPIRSASACPQK